MLAPECHQICHWRIVASLNISADELPALREADGIDGRGFGEDGMGGDICADLLDLQGKVPQEARRAVGRGVIVKADIIGEGAGVGFFSEDADRAETFSFIAVLCYSTKTLVIRLICTCRLDHAISRGEGGWMRTRAKSKAYWLGRGGLAE